MTAMDGRARILYIYAEEDWLLLKELEQHLASLRVLGLIESWHQGRLLGGQDIQAEIAQQLGQAQIVLVLLSASLLDAHWDLVQQVLRVKEERGVIVVPVLVRPVEWPGTLLAGLVPLPDGGTPVMLWENQDEAWQNVVQGIKRHLMANPLPPRGDRPAWARPALAVTALLVVGTALGWFLKLSVVRHQESPAPGPIAVPADMAIIPPADGVAPFAMNRTEVTNQAFADWLNWARVRQNGQEITRDGVPLLFLAGPQSGIEFRYGRYTARGGQASKPVVLVTWEGARRYCEAMGRRLPTSQEWVLAAYGPGNRRRFPWGDGELMCTKAVYSRQPDGLCRAYAHGPADVTSMPSDRTPEGVSDLAGNVAEWVTDEDRNGQRFYGGDWFRSDQPLLTKRYSYPVLSDGGAPVLPTGPNIGIRCALSLPSGAAPPSADPRRMQ